MHKKSQITVLIIIGLILIIITALVLFKLNYKPEVSTEESDFADIEEYVIECIEDSADEAIIILGKQGSLDPEAYTQSEDTIISYYYFKGKGYFPAQEEIITQLNSYVENDLYSCINRFSDREYVIDTTEIELAAEIYDGYVEIEILTPISVYHHGTRDQISIPAVEVETSLKKVHDASKEIIEDTIKDPEWIPVEKLGEKDLDIRIIQVNSSTLVYIITDNQTGGKPYVYRFAVKYDL